MEPLVAVYDACVLYPNFLRDFLVRLAIHGRRQGVLRVKWTGRSRRESAKRLTTAQRFSSTKSDLGLINSSAFWAPDAS